VIGLGLGGLNGARMSSSSAQGPTGIPDSEREYRQATWTLLNSMKNRQVRQDRILGFGFGATVALLIGLGIVSLKRPVQQLAKLRLDAHHASLARRQKHITRRQNQIKSLLSEVPSHV